MPRFTIQVDEAGEQVGSPSALAACLLAETVRLAQDTAKDIRDVEGDDEAALERREKYGYEFRHLINSFATISKSLLELAAYDDVCDEEEEQEQQSRDDEPLDFHPSPESNLAERLSNTIDATERFVGKDSEVGLRLSGCCNNFHPCDDCPETKPAVNPCSVYCCGMRHFGIPPCHDCKDIVGGVASRHPQTKDDADKALMESFAEGCQSEREAAIRFLRKNGEYGRAFADLLEKGLHAENR